MEIENYYHTKNEEPLSYEEGKTIIESGIIHEKLICRIQELQNQSGLKESTEEAIVNRALMNLLFDVKYTIFHEGLLDPVVLADLDDLEEIYSVGKLIEATDIETFLLNIDEALIDYNECLTKY